MSYDISFRVKVEGKPVYVDVIDGPNITWNVKELILHSSGWDIKNCDNNGPIFDWIKKIRFGFHELHKHPEKYRKYEASNGWGTVEDTLKFYNECMDMFEDFMRYNEELHDIAVVWVS